MRRFVEKTHREGLLRSLAKNFVERSLIEKNDFKKCKNFLFLLRSSSIEQCSRFLFSVCPGKIVEWSDRDLQCGQCEQHRTSTDHRKANDGHQIATRYHHSRPTGFPLAVSLSWSHNFTLSYSQHNIWPSDLYSKFVVRLCGQ